jgi:hypothetical protein
MARPSMDVVRAAHRYAFADRSNPFAFDQAMSHARTGVAPVPLTERFTETRTYRKPDGTRVKYEHAGYRITKA